MDLNAIEPARWLGMFAGNEFSELLRIGFCRASKLRVSFSQRFDQAVQHFFRRIGSEGGIQDFRA